MLTPFGKLRDGDEVPRRQRTGGESSRGRELRLDFEKRRGSNRYVTPQLTLHRWKTISEAAALQALESRASSDPELMFLRLEQLMPDLLDEMRRDLREYPLNREFIVLQRAWVYNSGGESFLAYYYDEHPELDKKLTILQNHGLIRDTERKDPKRFIMTEGFVRYFGV